MIETKSEGSKATVAGWSGDGDYIIVGHDNGYVSKYDSKTGKLVTSLQAHGIHNEEKTSVSPISNPPQKTDHILSHLQKTKPPL